MSLRIAFDLDGVLADMDGALAREAKRLFGNTLPRAAANRRKTVDAAEAPKPAPEGDAPEDPGEPEDDAADEAPPATRFTLTARQQSRLWKHVAGRHNFWMSLKELEPGVLPRIAALAAARRWEIIFLTKRPATAGLTSQVQSQRWLERHGFPLPSVFVVQRSRGRIATALGLDVVIDDTPENCLDVVADSKAQAILVWRDDEKRLPAAARRLGIGVVPSVEACLTTLQEADDSRHKKRPRMMDRVKDFLGMTEA